MVSMNLCTKDAVCLEGSEQAVLVLGFLGKAETSCVQPPLLEALGQLTW